MSENNQGKKPEERSCTGSACSDLLSKFRKLEKRVQNAECALMAYQALLHDTLPPAVAEGLEFMMQDFFNASTELGGVNSVNFIDR